MVGGDERADDDEEDSDPPAAGGGVGWGGCCVAFGGPVRGFTFEARKSPPGFFRPSAEVTCHRGAEFARTLVVIG